MYICKMLVDIFFDFFYNGAKNGRVSNMKNKTFKYILIFVIFFALGAVAGYFGTRYYLDSKEDEEVSTPVEEDTSIDITEDDGSQELIASLLKPLNNEPMFYSTKGISSSTMDNSSKLYLVYTYIMNNNMGTSEQRNSDVVGGTVCLNTFLTDVNEVTTVTNICNLTKIEKKTFMEVNKKLFNDELLDTSVNFNPENNIACIVEGDNYLCGDITPTSTVTGKLESHFDIEKVIKEEDGTIYIYERGFLNDKRSNVNNPNDQYDNYYLHSSDSTEYYYELKSADNLTFKHTFKTSDRQNYYYVSTELVKE